MYSMASASKENKEDHGEHSLIKAAHRRTARVLSGVICNSDLTGERIGLVERYSTCELIHPLFDVFSLLISYESEKIYMLSLCNFIAALIDIHICDKSCLSLPMFYSFNVYLRRCQRSLAHNLYLLGVVGDILKGD